MIYDLSIKSEHKRALEYLQRLIEGEKIVEFNICGKKRTLTQNNAIHKYFELVAKESTEAGYEMRDLVLDHIPIPITAESVKELWKAMQFAMLKTSSTSELKTHQVSEIYDAMNVVISERLKLSIPFPDKNYGALR